jgi:iron complex outermembrane recepter protein
MGQLKTAMAGVATLFMSMLILLSTAYARADEPTAQLFDIKPQSLAAALKEYAQQSHEEILCSPDIVARKLSSGVRGSMPPLAALNILLKDSGLSYTSRKGGAILVGPLHSAELSPVTEGVTTAAEEGKKDSSHDFRVAQVDQGKASGAIPVSGSASQSPDNPQTSIQEILVTARKREERLQDVPVPVTAISAAALTDTNQLRLQDYYSSIPGLVISPGAQSSNELAIRGVSPGIGNPTVGLTVDDVPYGASATQEGGLTVPDIDPSDLDHIEVLRGPQGTLYGANAMGGLIKFVTVDPSTQALRGQIQAGTSSVYNGAELGYTVRGSINVPLSDTFALRASGFTREDPGYIDNPALHIDGINKANVFGGHLSTLWTPSDSFSVKLSALYQDYKGDGLSDVDVNPPYPPTLGDLQQNYAQRVGPFSREVAAYSATLKAKLGAVDVTSVSGYNINGFHDTFDLTAFFGPATEAVSLLIVN